MWNDQVRQSSDDMSTGGSHQGSHHRRNNFWGQQVIVLLMGVLASLVLQASVIEAGPRIEAPEFEAVTLQGHTYSKASLLGRPTLLVFWAPWCHFCQLELPILAQFYRESKPAQLQILTIAFADKRANVVEYVGSNPNTFVFPTAYDEDDRIAKRFGVYATPTFVVMNAQGDLILAHQGAGLNANPHYQAFLRSLEE